MSSLNVADASEEHDGRLTGTPLKCCLFKCSTTLFHTAGVCHEPGTRTKVGFADILRGMLLGCNGIELSGKVGERVLAGCLRRCGLLILDHVARHMRLSHGHAYLLSLAKVKAA